MPRRARPRTPVDGELATPFTVVIDTREQRPYGFGGLRADADAGGRPLAVRTVVRGLPSGDYSLDGCESEVAVERKSLADLYGTIGQGRERFGRELARLDAMRVAAVVVEASWSQILTEVQKYSKLPPKVIFRSIIAWTQRYPRVHWWMLDGRRLAEVTTFRLLERYWKTRTPPEGPVDG